MKTEWVIARKASGEFLVRTARAGTRRAVSVQSAAGVLRRSRRQVYRYMKEGVLKPHGKFLGEWLLDPEEVRKLAALPAGLKSPPRGFRTLFPEYAVSRLNPYRDRALILSRVLDQGDRREIQWALKRYPASVIREFLASEGGRSLSPRSARFWTLYFGVPAPKLAAWRERGRVWGGAAG